MKHSKIKALRNLCGGVLLSVLQGKEASVRFVSETLCERGSEVRLIGGDLYD